ncbi:MAG: thioredoxin domain-containing protein [Betaproteobacteria bacterium]|nr:MAG: thioredoxin domain-containing protein [Betaproteobacteria bacterium]
MPNLLAAETSPYLLQHADNPVDWHPWNAEALALARATDKPILLSVGYSACHWCHVMAHESFEDAAVAAAMNRHFVNIKVDREERPDLDQIYQAAHQMLTGRSGGWPLTMFLMPDGMPFFGGTYFPKTPRYGMPGFTDLLPRIASAYREQRADILRQNAALREALGRTVPAPAGAREPDRAPLDDAVRELAAAFDAVHGGIGQAPKFPHPCELAFCLRRHALDGSDVTRNIAVQTLTKMAEGGIYDHLGGGFCRYSVDATWTIPHFEKMLCDNGLLLALYSDAWRVTQAPRFAQVAAETAAWVMREMQSPAGGYYSSFDADSEHEEGKFYVWTPHQVRDLLSTEEYAVVAPHYGLDRAPNFEGHAWHLRVMQPLDSVAAALDLPPDLCVARVESARTKLFAARALRVPPGRDDKLLASWNALTITGMARAARVFGEPAWLQSAQRAFEFVRTVLWRDGRLLATCKDGKAHLNAYLDDHAFLLDAALELLQAEFRAADVDFARALADALLTRFADRDHGGFFFTSHDHEPLIHRTKPGHDHATPSGNGIAAYALQRLGHLLGEPRYLAAAARALQLFYPELERHPSACVSLCTALDEYLTPPRTVVLRGMAPALQAWQQQLDRRYRPDLLILTIPNEYNGLCGPLDKPPAPAGSIAWVCRGVSCLPAITDAGKLARVLDAPP